MMKACHLVAAALLLCWQEANAFACNKKVRWFDDPPYSFQMTDGRIAGLDADVAREALHRLGCDTTFVNMPFARALVELQAGRIDVLPSIFRSTSRAQYALFSAPLPSSPNLLYLSPASSGRYRFTSLEDLGTTDFRLGVQIGVSYGEHFETLKKSPGFKAQLIPVTLRRSAWQMLERGRIDGMIADQASAAIELEQLGLSRTILPSKVVVPVEEARFAFSKASNSQAFVDAFDKELAKMIASGYVTTLRARYQQCAQGGKANACR